MTLLSATPIERARKAHGRILQSLQAPGSQVALAKMLGVSESKVSRLKNESLEDALALLYLCEFEIVDEDAVTVRPETLQFMRQSLARVFSDDAMAKKLIEDDE